MLFLVTLVHFSQDQFKDFCVYSFVHYVNVVKRAVYAPHCDFLVYCVKVCIVFLHICVCVPVCVVLTDIINKIKAAFDCLTAILTHQKFWRGASPGVPFPSHLKLDPIPEHSGRQ